jgi:hypothetical protein
MPLKFPGRQKLEAIAAIPRDAMNLAIAALAIALFTLAMVLFHGS